MRTSVRVFTAIGVFFAVVAVVYGFWHNWTEWAGTPALFAVAGMALMIAFYLWITARKFPVGAADDENGEISEYAGTYGAFAPWSWWPLGLGIACGVFALGLAVGWWVSIIGAGIAVYFLVGWVFEYSKGDHAH